MGSGAQRLHSQGVVRTPYTAGALSSHSASKTSWSAGLHSSNICHLPPPSPPALQIAGLDVKAMGTHLDDDDDDEAEAVGAPEAQGGGHTGSKNKPGAV